MPIFKPPLSRQANGPAFGRSDDRLRAKAEVTGL
jgi:hypothetical protein